VATVLVSPDEDMMSLSRRVDEVKKSLRDHRVDLVVEFKLRTQEMSFEYGE
jgi:ribosomal protein S15P/S13E